MSLSRPEVRAAGERAAAPAAAPAAAEVKAPSINLPKGGGAIRGIGEKFAANALTGTGTMSVPIATSPGRSAFDLALSLSYDSGAGNGPFGFGWSLSLPAITRKTDQGLPRYLDAAESDTFQLAGAEDLVPLLVRTAGGAWQRPDHPPRTVGGIAYRVDEYRPRVEGLLARIERWTSTADTAEVFWRAISRDNVTSWYGKTASSRIADPSAPQRIFSWLLCESHDDKGNAVVYAYKPEDAARIGEDAGGKPVAYAHESNRSDAARGAQRYIKSIRYGNRVPYFPLLGAGAAWPEPPGAHAADGSADWHFEVVFDYGEHPLEAPLPAAGDPWPARRDPFSSCRAGFELRSYRLCRRVLMFHHFAGEADVGAGCLVRSTEFSYADTPEPAAASTPVYAFLRAVTQVGYRRKPGGYDKRSLPPVEFEYTKPLVQERVEEVDRASLDNLPIGLDEAGYRWTDLHGEGLPGILSEQGGAWFYKSNLSPLPDAVPDDREQVKVKFAPAETVACKPNASLAAGARFMDLAGDGQPDLVVMEGPTPGFYEHDGAQGWKPFRPFAAPLNRNLDDPNLRFVDLDGDGHVDVLITEDDAFVWHASLAEDGFGPARRVARALDEERGARIVFADAGQSVYLADLSGDGLTDLVRIRNGEVCYWPNLGYGRFGAKVTMDNAPQFDNPDQFEHKRIRLADIDGSGTTDIIYLHREGVRLYFNQCGNAWSQPQHLRVFPRIDDLARILPADLLGNGTTCLVWSSALAGDAGRAMRYVSLAGRDKPHLLVRSVNNLGAETRITYAPSTRFYLSDKLAGTPWITRLPFPVQVVERVETHDHVSRNRFVTRYAYHHGHFDGEEREFRGFGMVEQWDTEAFATLAGGALPAANLDAASHVPPVHTKTWFHTGVYLGRGQVSDFFAGLPAAAGKGEYFREPGLSDEQARALLLPDTVLPAGLSLLEEREACRALKGAMLRQEVYADDAGRDASPQQAARARTPYMVTEQNFRIRLLQPREGERHGVFLAHPGETISYHYERDPADPRIEHALTLEADDFGNVLKQAAIGYGRRLQVRLADAQGELHEVANPGLALLDEGDRARQTTPLLTYTEKRYTGAPALADARRAPMPCEALAYELTGYAPSGPAGRFQESDFVEDDPASPGRLRHRFEAPDVAYEAAPTGSRRRRPIEWLRTLYRRDDLGGLLPLGELQPLALPGQSYKLALTPGLLAHVFQRPRAGQAPEALLPPDLQPLLGGQGGYLWSEALKADGRFPATDPDGHWWIPSGQPFFDIPEDGASEAELARGHFFQPRRYRDPFGQDTIVEFDAHCLLPRETRDALENRTSAENDYRVLQPRLVSDPNGNRTAFAFDALGLVAGIALMGKAAPAPAEGDSLAGFGADLSQAQVEAFFGVPGPQATAAALLGGASTRIVHDLDRFWRTRQANPGDPAQWQPACAATLARETHAGAPLPPQGLKIQIAVSHSDGFGREIQNKLQAEPGPLAPGGAPLSARWVASGWTIFNNKGAPVRKYEPFFSATHGFEFGVLAGVSPVLFYDPAGRVLATLHPNHSFEKVVFGPWQQSAFDANDTCAARALQSGDPRTDPDIGGFVAAHFSALGLAGAGWETWSAQRAGGGLGPHEQAAAARAASHADTPATAHCDVLGRRFLTVSRNRVACAGHDLDGDEGATATRLELDIEGNSRALLDERKLPLAHLPTGALERRVVVRYDYDMLGNRIRQRGIDAGARWVLADAAGRPLLTWDSRGHRHSIAYDALRRPLEHRVVGTTPESDRHTLGRELLVHRIEYGEGLANAQALNLRTRIYRQFDSAGMAANARLGAGGAPLEAYDFKGNLLCSTRRLASDYKGAADWLAAPALDAESFEGSTRYDALNRPIQLVAPHSSLAPARLNIVQPVYNEANLLDRVDVWLERAASPGALLDPVLDAPAPVGVANLDYDARGQRIRIAYRNGATTEYGYDPLTFRLAQLVTRREPARFAADDPQPPVPGWPGRHVQNLHYTYDPVGNITHVRDEAQQTVYFANQRVEPDTDFVYDALYRLIQAGGREHLGQLAGGGRKGPTAPDAFNAFHTGLDHPGDGQAMGSYVERYVYDAVGNFLQMQHRGADPAHAGWTRVYDYLEPGMVEDGGAGASAPTGNRLTRSALGASGAGPLQVDPYRHDAHGNMVRMPHLGGADPAPNLHWDYQDRLRQTGLGGGGAAWYAYDASGARVRKVWEKAPGLVEERIYLGAFEIFRRHGGPIGPGTATFERETLHLMDDEQRIALVETRTLDNAGTDPAPPRLIRYQFGNHLGSASLELDEQARIVSYEEYTPYGSTSYQAVRAGIQTPKRYRYTGKERDQENGLYYHGARYQAPWLGRWLSCDPARIFDSRAPRNRPASDSEGGEDGASRPQDPESDDESINLYRFNKNNPLRFTDDEGRQPISKAAEKIGIGLIRRLFSELGEKGARLAARKAAGKALKELAEGLGPKVEKHILEHADEVVGKVVHSVFKSGLKKGELLNLIKETIKSGGTAVLSRTESGAFAWVFEKEFKEGVGSAGQKILRVVVDKEGRVLTAFPVESLIKRIAVRGLQVSAQLAAVGFIAAIAEEEAAAADKDTAARYKARDDSKSWLETTLEWVVPFGLAESSPIGLEPNFRMIRKRTAEAIATAEKEFGRKLTKEEEQTIGQEIYNIWADSMSRHRD